MQLSLSLGLLALTTAVGLGGGAVALGESGQGPDEQARFWLSNALNDHGFTVVEAAEAAGVEPAVARQARDSGALADTARWYEADERLTVLPYPGGRHPRIGFLDGAIDPMRGTKASLFAPWAEGGSGPAFAVVDLPEAVFSNLGLTFLAHTHIPTIWDEQGVELTDRDWQRHADGSMTRERELPNGIVLGAWIAPRADGADMRLWLENGTEEPLSELTTQVCLMLKGLPGFDEQTEANKTLANPVAVARDEEAGRYVLTAWERSWRAWENPPVPCIHADPALPDCEPGERVEVAGTIRFYEGPDLAGQIEALQAEYDALP